MIEVEFDRGVPLDEEADPDAVLRHRQGVVPEIPRLAVVEPSAEGEVIAEPGLLESNILDGGVVLGVVAPLEGSPVSPGIGRRRRRARVGGRGLSLEGRGGQEESNWETVLYAHLVKAPIDNRGRAGSRSGRMAGTG